MKLIYTCCMVVGNEAENLRVAKEFARFVGISEGEVPVCPMLFLKEIDGDFLAGKVYPVEARLALLKACDELWYCGDGVTKDMVTEIVFAKEPNIPVRYVTRKELNLAQFKQGPNMLNQAIIEKLEKEVSAEKVEPIDQHINANGGTK